MKKYFERKALGWYILFTAASSLIAMLLMFISSILSMMLFDETVRKLLAEGIIYVSVPVFTLVFLLAGNSLVKRIQNDGKCTGEYSKYKFIFYPLACAATALINSVNTFVKYCFGTVKEILNEGSFEEGMVKSLIVLAINVGLVILDVVAVSKVIGSLLYAVSEGEESEKSFFSKIALPICISFAGVLIIDFLLIGLYDYGIITFAGNVFNLLLFAVMLLGLKYKYNDAKLRNIICNVLPFVYVGIQTVTAALKLFNAIY